MSKMGMQTTRQPATRYLLSILCLYFINTPVLSIIYHSDVLAEVEGDVREYSLCLHSSLNGLSNSITLQKGRLNTTLIAYTLLSQDKDIELKNDNTALQSMIGWADTRVTTAVLTRLDMRQRVRRSPTAPKLFVTTGSCHRVGLVDVMYTNKEDGMITSNSLRYPWILIDYNAFNIDDDNDWKWFLYGRSSLQELIIPLSSLYDMMKTNVEEKYEEKSSLNSYDFNLKTNSLRNEYIVNNILKTITNILTYSISSSYLIPNAKITIEIPYCNPNNHDTNNHENQQDSSYLYIDECRWLYEKLIKNKSLFSLFKMNLYNFKFDLKANKIVKNNYMMNTEHENTDNENNDIDKNNDNDDIDNLVAIRQWSPKKETPFQHDIDWSVFEVTFQPNQDKSSIRRSNKGNKVDENEKLIIESAYVLNLERREDRWKEMTLKWKRAFSSDSNRDSSSKDMELRRIDAVDGATLFKLNYDIIPQNPIINDMLNHTYIEKEKDDKISSSQFSKYTRKELTKLFSLSDINNLSSTLSSKVPIYPLNPYEDHGWRPSILGCALSHRNTWMEIASHTYGKEYIINKFGSEYQKHQLLYRKEAKSAKSDKREEEKYTNNTDTSTDNGTYKSVYASYLVLEDDVEFSEDFALRFEKTMLIANQQFDWDIIFLGSLDDRDFYGDKPAYWSCSPVNDGNNSGNEGNEGSGGIRSPLNCLLSDISTNGRVYGSGLYGYVIRTRAAYALLEASLKTPIRQPIDWWLWEKFNLHQYNEKHLFKLCGLKATPRLASSPEGKGRDSDNDEHYSSARFLKEHKNDDSEEPTSNNSNFSLNQMLNLEISFPPLNNGINPYYLSLKEASEGNGKVFIELNINQSMKEMSAGYWYEVHKFDLLCIQIIPISFKQNVNKQNNNNKNQYKINNNEKNKQVDIYEKYKTRKCAPMYEANIRIPNLYHAGKYAMRAFLIGGEVEEIAEEKQQQKDDEEDVIVSNIEIPINHNDKINDKFTNEIQNEEISDENPIQFINKENGERLIQSSVRYFNVENDDDDEVIPMLVNIDNQDVIITWYPSKMTLYDYISDFCKIRLKLTIPQELTTCMNSMLTAFLELRRQARGLHIN